MKLELHEGYLGVWSREPVNPIGNIGDFGGQTREPLENVG
jgi:hypothetical protein